MDFNNDAAVLSRLRNLEVFPWDLFGYCDVPVVVRFPQEFFLFAVFCLSSKLTL
jgi:hypothetical protein